MVKRWTEVDLPNLLPRLYSLGLTNAEVGGVLGWEEMGVVEYLRDHQGVHEACLAAKEEPNKRVEASLYKRALGYETREVHKVEGKPVKVVLKELAPDVVASIFWLKNRDPKRWRDTIDMQFTLRDRLNRAHHALSEGGRPQLENKGGNGGGGGDE